MSANLGKPMRWSPARQTLVKVVPHVKKVGKTYSVYSLSGTLLTTLFGGSIENGSQVALQVFSMGFLRIIMVGILLSFNKIVRDGLKKKADVKSK